MTTDPYTSPADAAEPRAGNPLLPVAITLIVMSVLWMLFCLFGIANFLFVAANTDDPGMTRFYWMQCGTLLTCLVFQGVLISGAMSMIRQSSYVWSLVTCWLACVPALSPCYLFAIPVGIWGLVVLWRPQTRALFPPTPPGRDPVLGVATGLITLAIMGMVFAVFGINYFVSTTLSDVGWQMIWVPLTFLAASFLFQCGLLYGGAKMIGSGTYRAAVVTCCLACVPFFGPCYFFAIPFGIWGLLVLRRPEVRAEWDGN